MIDKNILPLHLKAAREMLPNVPQDMFDMFFVTLVEDVGWPFKSKYDSVWDTEWQRVFNPFSLNQIADFEWVKKESVFDRGLFWDGSIGDVEAVVQNCFGLLPRWGNYDFDRCQKSTLYHLEKLTSGKGLDKPIVMAPIPDAGKFKILDGNHRMAAAWLCKLKGMSIAFDAWVAELAGLKSTNGGVC